MIEALERLTSIANTDTIVVPGHGLVADRHALVQFHDISQTVEDRILSLIKTRLTVSEVLDASPTAEFDSTWGKGYVTGVHLTRMVLAGRQHSEWSTAHSLQLAG
jgi:hypothetical protein